MLLPEANVHSSLHQLLKHSPIWERLSAALKWSVVFVTQLI